MMQYGLFTMPSHPPERPLYDGHRWDLQTLRWADELGFAEAWIGEHHTAPWEPHPAPDLLIAQGLLNFGVAASGLPSDWALFHVDGNAGQHREMTREALDIILKLWTAEEPFDYAGKYWQVSRTGLMLETLRPHIRPFQKPHPPIGVAGFSKNSDTLKLAGERGFLPLSLNLNAAYVASHWQAVEEGARRSGRRPRRADWRRHRIPETRRSGRRQRRDAGILRPSQLADRLAGHRHRQDRTDVRRGRRFRRAAAVLLRLQRQPGGLASFYGAIGAGSDAKGRASVAAVRPRHCGRRAAR